MSTPSNPTPPQEPDQPRYGQNAPSSGQYPPAGQPGQPGQYPPAGQPGQTGQPGYGQQAPYGYQAAQPSGYAYPSAASMPSTTKGPAPQRIVIASWLIIAAGVVSLISTILSSLNPVAALTPDQRAQFESSGVSPESLGGIFTAVGVVIGLVFAALYVLLALMIRKGKNWARITLTVLAALSLLGFLLGLVGGVPGTLLSTLGLLLVVAGAVLCFLKPDSEYFKPAQPRY
jgi:hypothetical protein